MIITTTAYPRAALIGNPSDGYNGKTIAFTFSNYRVEVQLYQSPELEILPASRDHSAFPSLQALVEDVAMFGYYGGIRLIKATLKKFWEYCEIRNIKLDHRNFTIRYRSTIPIRLGLAGSSAIISATTQALLAFYGVEMPRPVMAQFLLSVETEELGISAGLQDRVAMAYGGLIYMDFAKKHFERQGYGEYANLNPSLLRNVYIAYRTNLAEGSEVLHNNMRGRYDAGDPAVHAAVKRWAELTAAFRDVLEQTAAEFQIESPTDRAADSATDSTDAVGTDSARSPNPAIREAVAGPASQTGAGTTTAGSTTTAADATAAEPGRSSNPVAAAGAGGPRAARTGYTGRERPASAQSSAAGHRGNSTEDPTYGRILHERLSPIINENYDLRHEHLLVSEANHRMVMAARETGASAKFTGSGGAIIGTYRDADMLERMRGYLASNQIELIIPCVIGDDGGQGYGCEG